MLVLLLFGFGLCTAISPRAVVQLGRRWPWKGNRQPGTTALLLIRLVGIVLLLIATTLLLFLLLAAFSSYWEYGPS